MDLSDASLIYEVCAASGLNMWVCAERGIICGLCGKWTKYVGFMAIKFFLSLHWCKLLSHFWYQVSISKGLFHVS